MSTEPRVTDLRPARAVVGGRVTLYGSNFPVDREPDLRVGIGGQQVRTVYASPDRLAVRVPSSVDGGSWPCRLDGAVGEPPVLHVGSTLATGVHQVDNPVFDRSGYLYLTYSGSRGEQAPVSIFRVHPNGTREPFSSGVTNPTSMAIDPNGRLYVSSRFEGTVYRLHDDGTAEPFARDLGVACGLAFASDGTLLVGDRSGTIFRVAADGRTSVVATIPASVAAFHLAIRPDGVLFVTAPTLSPYDSVYRIEPDGHVSVRYAGFGRPQGVGIDPATGALWVVEALAGSSGVYCLRDGEAPELMVAGEGLVGVAFGPDGGLVVCSSDTVYRFDA